MTVRAAFPPELIGLGDIVGNLRWSWHQDSLDLLESVDPELWVSCGRDPVRMFGEVSAERLAVLAGDRKFRRRLSDVHDDLTDYLTQPRWYQHQQAERSAAADSTAAEALPSAIGYFSPEFGHRGATAVLGGPRHPRR